MADPKQLGRGSLAKTTSDDVVVVEVPGGGSITYSYSKNEWLIHQHQSISPEAMMLGMQQANAQKEVANAQFAVPAQEKTKQVRAIGIVVVVVALAAFVAACVRPEAAGSIAAIAGIVVGVFGGIYAVDQLRQKSPELPPGS